MVNQFVLLRDICHQFANILSVSLIVFYLHKHIQLLRVMYTRRMRYLVRRHPKIIYKYLVKYAALNLGTRCRLALLMSHYSLVQKLFNEAFATVVYRDCLVLWKDDSVERPLELVLEFPETFHTEGDLCITMRMSGQPAYRIVFILSSGQALGLGQQNIIFITCVQGLTNQAGVRGITEKCVDVHPADALMAAVQGMATALNITTLVGIRTNQQLCDSGKTFFSYDGFFEEYGELDKNLDAYLIGVPIQRKDLTQIPSKHRARTRRKRIFRDAVGDAVQNALTPYLCNERLQDAQSISIGEVSPVCDVNVHLPAR